MREAMILRSRESDSVLPRSGDGSLLGACAAGAWEAPADAAGASAAGAFAALAAASSTSCLRIRPPTPVPVTVDRSTSCWAAILRTSGVT